jgi:sulfotransferase
MRTHYYISGLPRSGSTLLCNILAQNPKFYVSPATSGCHDVLFGIRNQWDRLIEHQAEGIDYEKLRCVLRAAMESYHLTERQVVIDKGRGWLSLIEMLEFIKGEKPKIIVPVRNVSEILASFEQLWRKSTGQSQWSFESADYFKAQTIEGRCDIWAGSGQPVGLAYNRVKDAIARGHQDCMLFVEFDDLTSQPASTMRRIYEFLGEQPYEHNFLNVEQVSKEDDVNVHRIPGLHSIRPTVAPVPHKALEVLGPHLVQKYGNAEIWRHPQTQVT